MQTKKSHRNYLPNFVNVDNAKSSKQNNNPTTFNSSYNGSNAKTSATATATASPTFCTPDASPLLPSSAAFSKVKVTTFPDPKTTPSSANPQEASPITSLNNRCENSFAPSAPKRSVSASPSSVTSSPRTSQTWSPSPGV